ncbi:MAG: hypothetical protein K5657_02740 [Desulfovibrio sp.]|nr:hypothetical protein [Desulfovibrio sp.]
MKTLRYIHAARLQLNAPFTDLTHAMAEGESLVEKIQSAPFLALQRLESLALEQKPDFVLLTGDLTTGAGYDPTAANAILSFCRALLPHGIRVFIVHGLRDPLEISPRSLDWPENVTIFGAQYQKFLVSKQNEAIAVLHGRSLKNQDEAKITDFSFSRDQSHDGCFQIGLLPLLPSSERDGDTDLLSSARLDAWAIGGIDTPEEGGGTLPATTRAGSLQGLSFAEEGEHGCYVVNVKNEDGTWHSQNTFFPLAPLLWKTVSLDISGLEHLEDIQNALEELLERSAQALPTQCRTLLARVRLTGTTELPLTREKTGELCRFLRYLRTNTPEIFVIRLDLEAAASEREERALQRDDLLGEAVRLTRTLRANPDLLLPFLTNALDPLFGNTQIQRVLPRPDETTFRALLRDAEHLCMAAMEIENSVH